MTHDQELTIRSWCGTEKNPKYTSKYIGFEKGLAKIRSFLSDKENGKLYHILPNGDFLEMANSDRYTEDEIHDILLDTGNGNLIPRLRFID